MIKIVLISFLLIFISSCHQGSSYVSRYGQSIVLNPTQKQVKTFEDEIIIAKQNKKLTEKTQTQKKEVKENFDEFNNINFSSTKFLKGNADCIDIIRVKVVGSLSYDELMFELKKRAQTMGGNAIGIQDLKENKEVTYTNQRIVNKKSEDITNTLIKETNMLSSVTADIFKCESNI